MTRFDQSHDDTVDDPGHELGAEVPLHDGGEQQRVAADGAPVAAHAASHHRVAVVEVGEDLHQHLARQRPPAQLSHPPLLPGVGHSHSLSYETAHQSHFVCFPSCKIEIKTN